MTWPTSSSTAPSQKTTPVSSIDAIEETGQLNALGYDVANGG
ncbi:hypothetical protein FM112_08355 [Gulosibacter sp. 10]|nr:hypothetical protein FM112_08355 [Gulosibacter sp. 10]